MVLNNISVEALDCVKPEDIEQEAFQRKWSDYEWENKITVEKGEKEITNSTPANDNIPELTEEQKEYARNTVRKEFNENFSKWAEIDDNNATDEDIEQARRDEAFRKLESMRKRVIGLDDKKELAEYREEKYGY